MYVRGNGVVRIARGRRGFFCSLDGREEAKMWLMDGREEAKMWFLLWRLGVEGWCHLRRECQGDRHLSRLGCLDRLHLGRLCRLLRWSGRAVLQLY